MRALVITPQVEEQIRLVVEHADKNRYTLAMLREILDGKRQTPGDDPLRVLDIPSGFRVCFTIEEQPQPL